MENMVLTENPKNPEGFEDQIENMRIMKKRVPNNYRQTVGEIEQMAKGGDPAGVREEYYPGWENADFESLLMELGEAKQPNIAKGAPATIDRAMANEPKMGMPATHAPERLKQVPETFKPIQPETPQYSKPESSKAEVENAEDFIDRFILKNDDLSSAAKELIINKARSERGPWSVKNFIKSVTQNGRTITVYNNQEGAMFYYLKEAK